MWNESRYKPLEPEPFMPNGSSSQPLVPGTVARGELRTSDVMYTGRMNGRLVNTFPFAMTEKDLARGQERFDIYCSPCHSKAGDGQGMIVKRGFSPPPDYHIPRLMNAPVGHFYDVITNGYGVMYSYASRVSPEDRWRIAAYIRVLQHTTKAAPVQVTAQGTLGTGGASPNGTQAGNNPTDTAGKTGYGQSAGVSYGSPSVQQPRNGKLPSHLAPQSPVVSQPNSAPPVSVRP